MLDLKGVKGWIMFKYELLSLFCFYCGKIGYGERNCERKITDAKNDVLNEDISGSG